MPCYWRLDSTGSALVLFGTVACHISVLQMSVVNTEEHTRRQFVMCQEAMRASGLQHAWQSIVAALFLKLQLQKAMCTRTCCAVFMKGRAVVRKCTFSQS
jgi:hypothetical protein